MMRILKSSVLACLMLLTMLPAVATEPTAVETYFVELINRARANPGLEATNLGIELNEGVPSTATIEDTAKPPVAIDPDLTTAARAHASDMQVNNYFSHYSQDGSSPSDRCVAAGYNNYSGENIAYTAKWSSVNANLIYADQSQAETHHNNLFIDEDYPNRGHRTNMLSDYHLAVGVGIVDGEDTTYAEYYGRSVYSCTDFGHPSGTVYICGVIYSDENANSFYDVGEGASGVQLTVSETSQTINAWSSGAYSIPLSSSGTYTVTATYNGYQASKSVTVSGENVKVDFLATDFTGAADDSSDSSDDSSDSSDDATVAASLALGAYAYSSDGTFKSQTVIESGDIFIIWVKATGDFTETADMYVVMIEPESSEVQFMGSSLEFSTTQTATVSDFSLMAFDWLSLQAFYMPSSATKGTYTFAFLAVTPDADPYDTDNWLYISVDTLTHE